MIVMDAVFLGGRWLRHCDWYLKLVRLLRKHICDIHNRFVIMRHGEDLRLMANPLVLCTPALSYTWILGIPER